MDGPLYSVFILLFPLPGFFCWKSLQKKFPFGRKKYNTKKVHPKAKQFLTNILNTKEHITTWKSRCILSTMSNAYGAARRAIFFNSACVLDLFGLSDALRIHHCTPCYPEYLRNSHPPSKKYPCFPKTSWFQKIPQFQKKSPVGEFPLPGIKKKSPVQTGK